tara:strand:- start:65 stop:532 length:468 start_codon:yes stop_codon:yes gene_type:complete
MKKKVLSSSLLILTVLLLNPVAAFSFTDLFESWSYNSRVGEGFTFSYDTNVPEPSQKSSRDCAFEDHSSNGRYKKRCLSLTNPSYDNSRAKDFQYDAYFNARNRYKADQALDNAFRTYQSEVRQEAEIEKLKIRERKRYRFSYFSYRPYSSYYYW